MMKCNDKLLSDVKIFLGITWEDKDTNKQVSEMIQSGMHKIVALTGEDPSGFEQPSERKTLLYEYCRLSRAGVPEKFEEFNKGDIVRLRLAAIASEGDFDE